MTDEIQTCKDAGELLSRFPNHGGAIDVEEITPDEAAERFFSDFVSQHRPCVIRGAVDHWPATSQWDADVLRATIGACPVGSSGPGVLYEPVVELGVGRLFETPNRMRFDEFLDEVKDPSMPRVQLYSEHLHALAPLAEDLGPVDFLDQAALPSRFYGERFFISKRGYTDWHVHFGDETLTAQLTGRKELLFLPPDNPTFSTMYRMSRRGVWQTLRDRWPDEFAALTPHRVVLEPGDAVYIPMHWWHAAEALDDDLNVTFARVFGSPSRWLADVRLKNVRFSLAACLATSVSDAVSNKRIRPMARIARLSWMTARGAWSARAVNGERPGSPDYWDRAEAADQHSAAVVS